MILTGKSLDYCERFAARLIHKHGWKWSDYIPVCLFNSKCPGQAVRFRFESNWHGLAAPSYSIVIERYAMTLDW